MPAARRLAPATLDLILADLIRDEGCKLKPYRCTAGKLTIGIGYNIDDRGLAPLEATIGRPIRNIQLGITYADAVLQGRADIAMAERDARRFCPSLDALDPVRQRVLVNFLFNLGYSRAKAFKKCQAALARGDYADAALQMTLSLWARQVGDGPGKRYDRAERLADMMRTGEDPGK